MAIENMKWQKISTISSYTTITWQQIHRFRWKKISFRKKCCLRFCFTYIYNVGHTPSNRFVSLYLSLSLPLSLPLSLSLSLAISLSLSLSLRRTSKQIFSFFSNINIACTPKFDAIMLKQHNQNITRKIHVSIYFHDTCKLHILSKLWFYRIVLKAFHL